MRGDPPGQLVQRLFLAFGSEGAEVVQETSLETSDSGAGGLWTRGQAPFRTEGFSGVLSVSPEVLGGPDKRWDSLNGQDAPKTFWTDGGTRLSFAGPSSHNADRQGPGQGA